LRLRRFAATSATSTAPPRTRPGPSAGSNPCDVVCERTRVLGCPNIGECASSCAAMSEVRVCASEMAAVLQCVTREPVEHWECGAEGLASIRSGYCDPEQAAFLSCLGAGQR
jgi:hypothetical protein